MTKEREFDELVWVAFQFANGELDAATSANFESSLESDQMAQRALVAAVELVEVLDGIDLAEQLTKDPQAEIARLSKSHRGPEVAAIDPAIGCRNKSSSDGRQVALPALPSSHPSNLSTVRAGSNREDARTSAHAGRLVSRAQSPQWKVVASWGVAASVVLLGSAWIAKWAADSLQQNDQIATQTPWNGESVSDDQVADAWLAVFQDDEEWMPVSYRPGSAQSGSYLPANGGSADVEPDDDEFDNGNRSSNVDVEDPLKINRLSPGANRLETPGNPPNSFEMPWLLDVIEIDSDGSDADEKDADGRNAVGGKRA